MSLPVFDPPRKPSYVATSERPRVPIETVQLQAGYDQVRPLGIRAISPFTLVWNSVTEETLHYIESFLQQFEGAQGPFEWTPYRKWPSPSGIKPTLSQVGGGALGVRTYYVGFTWYDSDYGETKLSGVDSFQVAANNFLRVAVPPVPINVQGFRVYGSETEGSEELQATVTAGRTWTQTAAFVSGALPPSTNTLQQPRRFINVGEPTIVPQGIDDWQVTLSFVEQLV